MIKGIHTSASGMIPRVKKQEIIANNVANAGATGFKKDNLFIRELSLAERKTVRTKHDWEKPMADDTYVDFTSGAFDKTNNPLDLAIDGDGFFRLQGADGSIALTRNGAFMVDSQGYLSFPGGYRLMGESGTLQVGNGTVTVAPSGEVQSDGSSVGRVVAMTVPDVQQLDKIGSALFQVPPKVEMAPSTTSAIQQGYLETSNVDIVREMVDMIIAYREYEANAKALQQQDSSLDNLFNRVIGKN